MEKTREKPQEPKKDLTSSNHAFYVGKFIPRTFREELMTLVTGKEKSRIYSEEFYLMMLKEAFNRVQPGERVKVVIAPQLSEIFNGELDVKNALDVEEQKRLIRRLAKRYFVRDGVDIESVEDQPRHQPLFQALRGAVDPETGRLNLEKALEDPKDADFSEIPDSLEIARHLYTATRSSDTLKMVFRHAVPERFKEEIEKDEEALMGYYAMAEVAIRLSDILHGVEIHGGAARQDIYDQIITKIIKGRKGGYKNIQPLKKLFDLMESRPFDTVHLKTDENLYAESRRKFIQNTRRAVGVLLGLAALGTAFQQGIKQEQSKREKNEAMVRDSMNERLKLETFYWDVRIPVSKDHNVEFFNGIIRLCLKDLKDRYGMSESLALELRPLLIQYLLEHERPTEIDDNPYRRFDAVDRFVKKNTIFLQSKGFEVGRPYAELMPYLYQFEAAAMEKEDPFEFIYQSKGKRAFTHWGEEKEDLPEELTRLSHFVSGQLSNNFYEFYFYRTPEELRLLAREPWKKKQDGQQVFSAKRAREGALQFLYAVQSYDALELSKISDELYQVKNWDDFENIGNFISPCSSIRREDRNRDIMPEVGQYRDSLGHFDYEFLVEPAYDEEMHTSFGCLLAKNPEESHFTYERGREMAGIYNELHDVRWFDYYRGKYYEPMRPLDLGAIQNEVHAASREATELSKLMTGKKITKKVRDNLNALMKIYPSLILKEVDEYDNSYRATKEIVEHLEDVSDTLRNVKFEIQREYPELLPPE